MHTEQCKGVDMYLSLTPMHSANTAGILILIITLIILINTSRALTICTPVFKHLSGNVQYY